MLDPDCPNCECGGNLCTDHGCGVLGCYTAGDHSHGGYAAGGLVGGYGPDEIPVLRSLGCPVWPPSVAKRYAEANPSLLQQLNERPAMRPARQLRLGRLSLVPLHAEGKHYRFRGLRLHWFHRDRNYTIDLSLTSDERA